MGDVQEQDGNLGSYLTSELRSVNHLVKGFFESKPQVYLL